MSMQYLHKGMVWMYVCSRISLSEQSHPSVIAAACSEVTEDKFELTSGTLEELTLYEFYKKIYKHYFCPVCGVQIMLTKPGKGLVEINVRTVDGPIDLNKLKAKEFDGKSL